ncbi:hypothetical protein ACHWQZ_G015583 [Mnemiopsis leidyi]
MPARPRPATRAMSRTLVHRNPNPVPYPTRIPPHPTDPQGPDNTPPPPQAPRGTAPPGREREGGGRETPQGGPPKAGNTRRTREPASKRRTTKTPGRAATRRTQKPRRTEPRGRRERPGGGKTRRAQRGPPGRTKEEPKQDSKKNRGAPRGGEGSGSWQWCSVPTCKTYEITHETDTTSHADSSPDDIWFAIFGTSGETSERPCVADRGLGATGSCVLEDGADIGLYLGVRIRNSGTNRWNCRSIQLVIEGVVQREIKKVISVGDYETAEAEVTGNENSCNSLPSSWINVETSKNFPISYGAVINDLTCSEVGQYNGRESVTCAGDDKFVFSVEEGALGCTSAIPLIPVREATMTSSLANGPPKNLFDGNYLTIAHSESETSSENVFTISLKLSYEAAISVIKIANRKDCCGDRIIGFKVYISSEKRGEVECGTISENRPTYEFRCNGVGNEVKIRKEGLVEQFVNLAEVEVFGSEFGEVGCWDPDDKNSKGSGYDGTQSITRSGGSCLNWARQTNKNFNPSVLPNGGLGDHNYCRNPDGSQGDVWCFTTSGWNYCDVPSCPDIYPTCPTTSYIDITTNQCKECPAGTFGEDIGPKTSCTKCDAGTASAPGSGSCVSCSADGYEINDSNICAPCPAGWYKDSSTTVCVKCSHNKISGVGAGSCIACPPETYAQDGQTKCGSFCPSSFPYAYLMGQYCCKTGKEAIGGDELCDGSDIGIDSSCCQDHAYTPCPNFSNTVKCSNYLGTRASRF